MLEFVKNTNVNLCGVRNDFNGRCCCNCKQHLTLNHKNVGYVGYVCGVFTDENMIDKLPIMLTDEHDMCEMHQFIYENNWTDPIFTETIE